MDLNSGAWRDLVFEGKNKEYGAYYLRRTSSKRHLYSLLIVVVAVGCATLSLIFFSRGVDSGKMQLNPVVLSELPPMQSVYDPQVALPEKKIQPKSDAQPASLEIVADEDAVEPPDRMADLQQSVEAVESIMSDSLLAGADVEKLVQLQPVEEEEALVLYDLGQTNQDDNGFKMLQANILRYIYNHIRYPDVAYKQRIKGRVVYSFVINADGSLSDITLVQGVYIFLDEEVLRVIQSMPVQEPVKKDGKPVKAKIYLPVEFAM